MYDENKLTIRERNPNRTTAILVTEISLATVLIIVYNDTTTIINIVRSFRRVARYDFNNNDLFKTSHLLSNGAFKRRHIIRMQAPVPWYTFEMNVFFLRELFLSAFAYRRIIIIARAIRNRNRRIRRYITPSENGLMIPNSNNNTYR